MARHGTAITAALAHAHTHGVVHRYLKPSNVLLDGAGQAKLTDFGISRLVGEANAGWTVTGAALALGTPGYLAPEVLSGGTPSRRRTCSRWACCSTSAPPGPVPWRLGAAARGAGRGAAGCHRDGSGRAPTAAALGAALAALRWSRRSDGLPEDERLFLRGTALLCTASAAAALAAGLRSLSPRVLQLSEVEPLTQWLRAPLADGRVVSLARLEVVPILGAVAALAAATFALGMLRRHWRLTGWTRRSPCSTWRSHRRC